MNFAGKTAEGEPTDGRKKCVLIVDDEKNIVNILKFNLQKEGYQTLEAYDGETGLAPSPVW